MLGEDSSLRDHAADAKKMDNEDTTVDDGISSASSSDGLDGEQQAPKTDESAASEYEDILGSGQLFRKVLKSGTGDRTPVAGDLVCIRVEGQLEDGKKVDCCDELPFLVGHSEVIAAFDVCVSFMKVGEIDSIRTAARFAYAKAGKDDEIPPDAPITYTIELLSLENGPNVEELSLDERLIWVNKKKQRGNYYFQREEYTSAIDVYERALKLLEPNPQDTDEDRRKLVEVGATLYNNLGAAQLKIEAWDAAVQSLRRCILVEPKNVKAHFRMAKAHMGRGDYANAIVRLKEMLELDPDNKAVQAELTRASALLKRENEASKNLYKRMFSKPTSATENKGSIIDWVKDHCTLTNGTVVAAAAVAVLYFSHSFVSRYFN